MKACKEGENAKKKVSQRKKICAGIYNTRVITVAKLPSVRVRGGRKEKGKWSLNLNDSHEEKKGESTLKYRNVQKEGGQLLCRRRGVLDVLRTICTEKRGIECGDVKLVC